MIQEQFSRETPDGEHIVAAGSSIALFAGGAFPAVFERPEFNPCDILTSNTEV
jgi:hypothetical protein